VWLYGKTGVGKTRRAVDEYGGKDFKNIYMKNTNKWWDGYLNQETVIIDDVDPKDGEWMCGFFKRWTDRYPCILEINGGQVIKRYKKFIVTSNHSLD